MAGSTSAPSTSTSIAQPSRGGGASRHQSDPSSGAASASRRPSRSSRRRCLRLMAASIASPASASAAARGSTRRSSPIERAAIQSSPASPRCLPSKMIHVAILALVQVTAAPTHATPAELAAELLSLWHHLLKGGVKGVYALLDELDLGFTHVKTLHTLADLGTEVSVKQLAEHMGMSLPGASRVADALHHRGY